MSERHYEVFRPRDIFIWSSELEGAKHCSFPTATPACPDIPEGEWYCFNPECVVREVRVRCKLYSEDLPTMNCPACGEEMRFHHWIGAETLVPVRDGPCAHPPQTADPPKDSGATVGA